MYKAAVCGAGDVKGARTAATWLPGENTGEQPKVHLKIGISSSFFIPEESLVPASEPLRAGFTYHSGRKVQSRVKPPK